jgi:hypothetical protein
MRPSRPLRRLVALCSVLTLVVVTPSATAGAGSRDRAWSGVTGGDRDVGIPRLRRTLTSVQTDGIVWSDVPVGYWARTAIDYVGGVHRWMRDYRPADDGTYPFRPGRLERRAPFARSIVRAFAPQESTDPSISFPDLPHGRRISRFANVAVKLGWMQPAPDGGFLPKQPVTTRMVHRALVLALGLGDLAAGADALHLRNGTTFDMPRDFGTLLIGMRIGLRYNHGDESMDVTPTTPLNRAETAWSLYRAATMPGWMPPSLAPSDRRSDGSSSSVSTTSGTRTSTEATGTGPLRPATAAAASRSGGSTAPDWPGG